jgi:hypothetical protein
MGKKNVTELFKDELNLNVWQRGYLLTILYLLNILLITLRPGIQITVRIESKNE